MLIYDGMRLKTSWTRLICQISIYNSSELFHYFNRYSINNPTETDIFRNLHVIPIYSFLLYVVHKPWRTTRLTGLSLRTGIQPESLFASSTRSHQGLCLHFKMSLGAASRSSSLKTIRWIGSAYFLAMSLEGLGLSLVGPTPDT